MKHKPQKEILAFSLMFCCLGLVFQRFVGDVEELLRTRTKKFLGNFLETLRQLVMRLWESNFLLHPGWLERDSVCGSGNKPLKKWDFRRRPHCPRGGCQCLPSGSLFDYFHQSSSLNPPPTPKKGSVSRKFKVCLEEQKAGRLSPSCSDTCDLSKSIRTPIPRKRTLLVITKLQKTGPASPATEPAPHSEGFEQMVQNVFRSSYRFKNEIPPEEPVQNQSPCSPSIPIHCFRSLIW